jgi:hypothetical protein
LVAYPDLRVVCPAYFFLSLRRTGVKKTKLCKAVAMATALSGLGVGMYATTASAVNLPANGIGEVLIFPYYTTRADWRTQIHLVNTDEKNILAVKLRFYEGYNSRDVLDLAVIMSPGDVFAGVVTQKNGIPHFVRAPGDTTCTSPYRDDLGAVYREFPFNSDAYNAPFADGGPTDDERMREGYVVAFVMGAADKDAATTGATLKRAIHDPTTSNNSEADCDAVDKLFLRDNILATARQFAEPVNALKGNYTLLNLPAGTAAGGNAVALANFVTIAGEGTVPAGTVARPACTTLITDGVNLAWDPNNNPLDCPNLITAQQPYEFLEPSLDNAYPRFSQNVENFPGFFTGAWFNFWGTQYGFQAVSELLRAKTVVNEWSLNPGLGVKSDWVITHPTKGFFTDSGAEQAAVNTERFATPLPAVPGAPFAKAFNATNGGKSCNDVGYRVFNPDEKYESPTTGGTSLSPAKPKPNMQLCYETNVIPFSGDGKTSSVLGSVLLPNSADKLIASVQKLIDATAGVKTAGWMTLTLAPDGSPANSATGNPLAGRGLPAVGFLVRQRAVPAEQDANYSDAVDHSYERDLFNPPVVPGS